MINSMIVNRERVGDLYKLKLEVPEKEYYEIYKSLDDSAAEDIINQYRSYYGDDGNFFNAKIHHNKNLHIIRITCDIDYQNGVHTAQFNMPAHLGDIK
ncbi:MAG TPA: hypothetical protein DD426_02800 [Clostridiaceae bacterium]|nr:hypothetical protein [Clostridiaceae bacterium]